MTEYDFFNYFNANQKGFAIEIVKLITFSTPLDPCQVIPNFIPPQSFKYVDSYLINLSTNHISNEVAKFNDLLYCKV
jgi:hypothetical protein